MKNLLSLNLLVFVSAVVIYSCSKEDDNKNTGGGGNSSIAQFAGMWKLSKFETSQFVGGTLGTVNSSQSFNNPATCYLNLMTTTTNALSQNGYYDCVWTITTCVSNNYW